MITTVCPEEGIGSVCSHTTMVVILPHKHTLGGNMCRKTRILIESCCEQNHFIAQTKLTKNRRKKLSLLENTRKLYLKRCNDPYNQDYTISAITHAIHLRNPKAENTFLHIGEAENQYCR